MKKVPNNIYEKYKDIVYHQAHRYCIDNFDIQEMISEGFLVLCQSYHDWDKTKSKFSTFLFYRLSYRFRDITGGKRGKYNINTDILGAVGKKLAQDGRLKRIGEDALPVGQKHHDFLIEHIPADCKRLARLVLAHEITHVTNLASLQLYLRKKGWKWVTIKSRIKKLKNFYEENHYDKHKHKQQYSHSTPRTP